MLGKMNVKTTMAIFLAIVLVISVFAAVPVHSFENGERDIVLVRTSDNNDLMYLETLGADVLQTYETFTLVEIDPAVIPQLERMGMSIDMMEHRNTLYVNDQKFDFTRGEPEMPSSLRVESYAPDVQGQYIVHTIGPIAQDWVPTLDDMGVQVLNYLPNYAYRVRMTPELASEVSELYFVDWIGIYHPYYKLQPDLNPGMVNIGLVSGANRESLDAVGQNANVISSSEFQNGEYFFTVFADSANTLHELARVDDVLYITEHPELELQCEMSTQIIGGGLWFFDDDNDPDTAYRAYGDYGSFMNQLGYEGDGEVIAVADSGLGGGSVNDQHADFQDRVIGGYSYSGGWEDGHGHGTHCAGSVAGHTYGGTGTTVFNDYYAAEGSAPSAELYSVRVFGGSGGSQWIGPEDIYHIVQIANQNSDAYVHTNSWGTATGDGTYIQHSSRYDAAARGEDMVILCAAGNSGTSDTTIIAPGTGKNVIAVGATNTYNPNEGLSNPEEIASFSSRGWTTDNRIKPDVVAPGHRIYSTNPTSGYQYMSGTSMATPAAAGAAAVIVEWYEINHWDNERPSPAMVKALMINTAEPIDGNTEGPIPNRDEGWGMVDISKLERPLNDPIPFRFFDQEHVFTESGQVEEHYVSVDREDEPMKFSLVWTDKEAPADTGSGPTLINDLNIEVEAPSGHLYRGNAFSGGWSEAGAEAMSVFDRNNDGWDDTNNVENVYIHPDEVEIGTYKVRIEAKNIADDGVGVGYNSQDFALAVHNANPMPDGEPPEVNVISPDGGEVWNARTQEEITWTATGGDAPVNSIALAYSINNGDSWSMIAMGLDNTGSYTWTIPNDHSSDCLIRVRAIDTEGRWNDSFSDDVFTIVGVPPVPPQNLDVEHISQWIEVFFEDDVEDGDLGYITGKNMDGASDWGIRQHGASSGVNSWDFGDGQYNKVSFQGALSWLISPAITVPAEADEEYGVWFTFQHWRDFYSGLISLDDGGNVKISTSGSDGPWTIITPEEGYDGTLSSSWSQPLGGQPGWSHTVGWSTATFDLTAYIGETVHIRWDAGAGWGGTAGAGWRIDDLRMECQIIDEDGDKDNRITWNASPDETIDEVSHYNLYRSEAPGGPWDGSTLMETFEADGSASYSYVDYDKGMPDGIFWWYVVRAVGTNGLEELNTNAVQEPGGETENFDIPLTAGGTADGWNFVSFNLVPESSSLSAILEDIDGNYDRVMYFDAGNWYSYVPGRAEQYNNLHSWNHRMGLWIRMTTDDTLTITGSAPSSTDITLNPGWTMVGLPSETAGNQGLPSEVDKVGYSDSSAEYNIAYDTDPGSFVFEPGKGYWVHNPTDTAITWTVDY